ncbi:MAG TPA: hypothetical protein VFU14_15260 [Acidimicrobiales bacterium]|nr:hypothetical protein [Acidimicrobiales bacterium]
MGRSPFRRAAALVAATSLLVAACGDDDPDTTAEPAEQATTTTQASPGADQDRAAATTTSSAAPVQADEVIEVEVRGGEVVGGGRHEVALGDTVAIIISSDVADEVHVHGYDVSAHLDPGASTTLLVEASLPGVWEVELHDLGSLLLELAVS